MALGMDLIDFISTVISSVLQPMTFLVIGFFPRNGGIYVFQLVEQAMKLIIEWVGNSHDDLATIVPVGRPCHTVIIVVNKVHSWA